MPVVNIERTKVLIEDLYTQFNNEKILSTEDVINLMKELYNELNEVLCKLKIEN